MLHLLIALTTLNMASPALAAETPSPYAAELVLKAQQQELWREKQWRKLMHYEPTWLHGWESQADDPSFFLAPNGKKDLKAELEADLQAFFQPAPVLPSPPPKDTREQIKYEHPRCRFPARFMWLKEKLSIDESKLPAGASAADCARFNKFATALAAKSVTVVFSSYFLNNPSSAFGHTLLRLNKSEHTARKGERFELLDYGVGYAAVSTTNNPVLFAFKGMTGLFNGALTSVPYYYKVREYNDYEARDLWQYDVNLTQAQIDLLIAHLWEFGNSNFDYYYLTENCAYHVLGLLEAANPALDLTDRLPFYVIPADTIRVLMAEPGFVKDVTYRPSVRAQFQARAATLSTEEARVLQEVVENYETFEQTSIRDSSPESKVKILDAAADFMDLKFGKDLYDRESEASRIKQKLLLTRAKIGVTSPEVPVPAPWHENPHVGHGSRRASVDFRHNSFLGNYGVLGYRFALHDLMDPQLGYPAGAQIEFAHVELGVASSKQDSFWLENFSMFKITSLSPLTQFKKSPSWRMNLGAKTFYDNSCVGCTGFVFDGGGGIAVKTGDLPVTLFAMMELELAAAPKFNGSHFRPGVGPSAGVRIAFNDDLIFLAQGLYRYNFFQNDGENFKLDGGLRWGFAKNWGASVKGALQPGAKEVGFGLHFYH